MGGFFRILLGGALGAVLGILFMKKQTVRKPSESLQPPVAKPGPAPAVPTAPVEAAAPSAAAPVAFPLAAAPAAPAAAAPEAPEYVAPLAPAPLAAVPEPAAVHGTGPGAARPHVGSASRAGACSRGRSASSGRRYARARSDHGCRCVRAALPLSRGAREPPSRLGGRSGRRSRDSNTRRVVSAVRGRPPTPPATQYVEGACQLLSKKQPSRRPGPRPKPRSRNPPSKRPSALMPPPISIGRTLR